MVSFQCVRVWDSTYKSVATLNVFNGQNFKGKLECLDILVWKFPLLTTLTDKKNVLRAGTAYGGKETCDATDSLCMVPWVTWRDHL